MGKYVTYWSKTFHVEVVRDPVNSSLDSFLYAPKACILAHLGTLKFFHVFYYLDMK